MGSLVARYKGGDWAGVWEEIRRRGPVSASQLDEVNEVASVTMQKAAVQIQRIVERLLALGFQPASGKTSLIEPPPPDVTGRIRKAETSMGQLPSALKACMTEIGAVSLLGDLPSIGLYYNGTPSTSTSSMPPGPDYPDPLYLPGIDSLEWEFGALEPDPKDLEGWSFPFAPDELHKANISGGTHDIQLPDSNGDPILHGVAGRPGITLVEYLRLSVSWGGFPGYSFDPSTCPPAIKILRSPPQF